MAYSSHCNDVLLCLVGVQVSRLDAGSEGGTHPGISAKPAHLGVCVKAIVIDTRINFIHQTRARRRN